jgi:inorganic triphosphatase YgiF
MLSLIDKVEQEAEKIWREVDGEARAELKQAVADAKTELAKFLPLVTQAKADVEAAVEAAEPAIKAAVEAVLEKLAADAGTLLAGGSPDTPAPAPSPAPTPAPNVPAA